MNREQFDREALVLGGECNCQDKKYLHAEDRAGMYAFCQRHGTKQYIEYKTLPKEFNMNSIPGFVRMPQITGILR